MSDFDEIRAAVLALGFQVQREDRTMFRIELAVIEPLAWSYDNLTAAHVKLLDRFGQRFAADLQRGLLRFCRV